MEASRDSFIPLLLRCVNCPDLHDRNKAKMRFLSVFPFCRKTMQSYDNNFIWQNFFPPKGINTKNWRPESQDSGLPGVELENSYNSLNSPT